MVDRIGNFIIAIALFLSAIQAFTKKEVLIKSFMPKANLDFGYLWLIVGILCLCLSFAFFYLAFRSEKSIKRYIQFMRCKQCREIYPYREVKDKNMICPKCGGKLQDYAEFEKEQEKEKQAEFKEAEKFQEEWIKKIKEERKNQ
ncbi:endonuclease Q family protein [Campylobacter sp. JMF_02 ED1]|uniref:adenylate kinase n=1 Tax=unclassified Campylobacter TaxID=2593542 RepID=UPI0022E9FE85|nr:MULTISPECIES: adenylate kinase [unclassified Campylobacter]MDA3050266.1 endonuclease Q family protein [Campylobacter sp. JMF_15 NE4]MDA3051697.1 endonuclease Q family protein [Campylobacter sp. JMF_02 ED1]